MLGLIGRNLALYLDSPSTYSEVDVRKGPFTLWPCNSRFALAWAVTILAITTTTAQASNLIAKLFLGKYFNDEWLMQQDNGSSIVVLIGASRTVQPLMSHKTMSFVPDLSSYNEPQQPQQQQQQFLIQKSGILDAITNIIKTKCVLSIGVNYYMTKLNKFNQTSYSSFPVSKWSPKRTNW